MLCDDKIEKNEKRSLFMRYGFIGLGNMASAIIAGMAACGACAGDYPVLFLEREGLCLGAVISVKVIVFELSAGSHAVSYMP